MKKTHENLPKISVITPTLNQGNFIEKTIKSVLDQKYPNLEYIVMDGGSTDNTLKVLNKFKDKLKFFSGKDKGQSDAINKGIISSTGDIICFVNSDDYLLEGSLKKVADFFLKNSNAFWLTGKCYVVDEKNKEVRKLITLYKNLFLKYLRIKKIFSVVQFISQPSTFWRREVFDKVGPFDIRLNYDMDYDYWLRIWKKYPLYYMDEYLSSYRVHKNSKAVVSPSTQFEVQYQIIKKYERNKFILFLHYLHAKFSLFIYKKFLTKKQI